MELTMRSHALGTMFLCWLWSMHARVKNNFNKSAKETSFKSNLDVISTNDKRKEESITISEALERTLYGKFNYFVIAIAGLVLSNVLLETSAVAFYMPVSHCELELTNSRKGLLSAIGYIGMIVSSHLWGFLADTKGRKRIIQPTIVAGFVITVISSFATSFWSILVLRFMNGVCVCGASATVYAYLGELHTDGSRSKAMMVSSFIYALGAMIMPFISFGVINRDWSFVVPFLDMTYKPWRLFIVVCGLPGLVCSIAMCFLPESPKFLLSANREDEAKKVLQQIYRMNGGKDKLELPHLISEEDKIDVSNNSNTKSNSLVGFLKTMWHQTVPMFERKYIRSTAIVCIVQFWFYFISNGLYMWFPYIVNAIGEFTKNNPGENKLLCQIVYDKHDKLAEDMSNNSTLTNCPDKLENSTYIYSLLMEILYVSSFAIITLIVNRVGKIVIMFVLIVFSSSSGFVAVLLPNTFIATIFYVLLFLVGVSINLLGAATVDLYPTQLRAMALSVSLMMGRIGSVVGTNIVGGLLADNCELTFYITCCAMMSCGILILFLPRSIAHKKSMDEAIAP